MVKWRETEGSTSHMTARQVKLTRGGSREMQALQGQCCPLATAPSGPPIFDHITRQKFTWKVLGARSRQ